MSRIEMQKEAEFELRELAGAMSKQLGQPVKLTWANAASILEKSQIVKHKMTARLFHRMAVIEYVESCNQLKINLGQVIQRRFGVMGALIYAGSSCRRIQRPEHGSKLGNNEISSQGNSA